MEEVKARLNIEVFVDCPNKDCGFLIDLMEETDTDGYHHNEEAGIISQACPDGHWGYEHKKFECDDVTCSECKTTFNVRGLDW